MRIILSTLLLLSIASNCLGQDAISIKVDFGGTESEFPWNNIENSQSGALPDLINQFGTSTGISITVNDAFNGTNTNGTQTPDPVLGFPTSASGDSFFGNAVEFEGVIEETGGVTISGLNPETAYTIELFASRDATDNRETTYIVDGLTSETHYLNVSSNTSESISISNFHPNENGSISITASIGPNNDNNFGFFYLGALKLSYEGEIVELDSLLVLNDPLGEEYWQAGKTPEIRWTSQNIEQVLLEYSVDQGATWVTIDEVSAYTQSYNWLVPELNSEDCLIRISSGDLQDQSETTFTINASDNGNCHVVVLGSSTAAGIGPTSLDNAWVWLYEDFIFQRDTRFKVTNLAQGGFTTYHILPNGTEIPNDISFGIDPTKNITQALSLEPNAIIINLPSNDAANSISVADQIQNYELILSGPGDLEIPYWICTPQPRNGFNTAQQMIQNELLDSTLSLFANNYIDFWTGLSTDDNQIDAAYNSGDGVHLNDGGHEILFQRVLDVGIDSILLDSKNTSGSIPPLSYEVLELYPNPTTNFVRLKNIDGPYEFKLFDSAGNLVNSGLTNEATIQLKQKGLHFLIIEYEGETFLSKVLRR